jgi:hypothetical protein
VKTKLRACNCGHDFDFWLQPFLGLMNSGTDGIRLDVRNCPNCGTTVSEPVKDSQIVKQDSAR